MYCQRCGGIINEKQTVIQNGEHQLHYYCQWKNHQEENERKEREREDRILQRDRNFPEFSSRRIKGRS